MVETFGASTNEPSAEAAAGLGPLELFRAPRDSRTADYLTGRFG